jgi:hypothetical protein
MLCPDPRGFEFIPVRDLIDYPHSVPNKPGVYAFFLRGGTRLLEATSWFELDDRRPLSRRGHQHLYTGAADFLGERLKQHMRIGHLHNSSVRKSLLAIEYTTKALSRSGTPACEVRGQLSLTEWLRKNSTVGICFNSQPFELERMMLALHPSPLNITWRREHPYARQLSQWRCKVFPPGDSRPSHRMRRL